MKMTVFQRILLATLLPVIGVFFIVILAINNIIYSTSAEQAKQAATGEANQIHWQFSTKLGASADALRIIGHFMVGMNFNSAQDEGAMTSLLSKLIQEHPMLLGIQMIIDTSTETGIMHFNHFSVTRNSTEGEDYYTSNEQLSDLQGYPYYQNVKTQRQTYLNISEENGKKILFMARPIVQDNRPLGVLSFHFDMDKLLKYKAFQFKNFWQVSLISSQNGIAPPSSSEKTDRLVWNDFFNDQNALQQFIAGKEPLLKEFPAGQNQEHTLFFLYPITIDGTDTTYFLNINIPAKKIDAFSKSSIELIISTSIIGLILLAFCVFWATRSLVRPIKTLTVAFDKISSGDLGEAANSPKISNVKSNNVIELDILQSSLEKMLEQISQATKLRLHATEEKLEREKLLAESKAKTQFLANVSHEIRTPMNAIIGISEIVLHNNNLTEQDHKHLNNIKYSSNALLSIINDILDVAKIDSGKMEIENKDFDFHQLIENVCSLAENLATPNDLQFIYEERSILPKYLWGDGLRLRQVLLNLISNACKFTIKGSVILAIEDLGEELLFSVKDTGYGIKKEDLEHLFVPFKRLELAGNQAIQGTGLGLSISKSILEMMGGSIAVESEYQRGSRFKVTIPKVLGSNCAQKAHENVKNSFSPEVHVLVVDDNEINLTVAEGLLHDVYGVRCDLALSGAEALTKIEHNDYTLVLMDHMMPGMDGIETARLIRMLGGKCTHLPIIACTANSVKGVRERLMAAGIDDYLSKPIQLEELEQILTKWVPKSMQVGDKTLCV